MSAGSLPLVLTACEPRLPEPFRSAHVRLFRPDLLSRLADRLVAFHVSGVPTVLPPPHFAAECTPPLDAAWDPFRDPMALWAADRDPLELPGRFAEAVVVTGTPALLLLLGQRLTPASIRDLTALPPAVAALLAAAEVPYRPDDPLSVAARALAKHARRASAGYWRPALGPPAAQNGWAVHTVRGVLDGATWWNVFVHPKHGTVFEARVASGHGARWRLTDLAFVDFLEPFFGG